MQLEYKEKQDPASKLEIQNISNYKLKQIHTSKLLSEGLVINYDEDNQYIAIGCRNGNCLLHSIQQNKIINSFDCLSQTAITTLKWRPTANSKFKVIAIGDADGSFSYLHVPTMKKIFNLRQDNNSILTMDFTRNAEQFATAGKDCAIKIYDEETKTVVTDLKKASWNYIGHDNRIFAVKFIDDHTIISGGWDTVMHIWDLREGKSIRHFYGPHVSGQSIDYKDGNILVGCYAATNQIQIWNFNTGTKIEEIDWTGNVDEAQYVYTASYGKNDLSIFGAGSTGSNSEVRLYKKNINEKQHKKCNAIKGVNQGCFSLNFNPHKSQFCFTTAHHGFYIYHYQQI